MYTGSDPFSPMMTFKPVSKVLKDQRKMLLEAMPGPEIGLQRVVDGIRCQEEVAFSYGNDTPYGNERLYTVEFKEFMESSKAATASDEKLKRRVRIMATLNCAFVGCCRVKETEKDEFVGKKCSGCKIVRYCSAEYQKKDWVKYHKPACKLLAGEQQQ